MLLVMCMCVPYVGISTLYARRMYTHKCVYIRSRIIKPNV